MARHHSTRICSIEECNRPVMARGLCQHHYDILRRHGTLTPPPRHFQKDDVCSVEDCGELVGKDGAKGMCAHHYRRWRLYGRVKPLPYKNKDRQCSVEGCERPAKAHGLCNTHNERRRKTGSVADPIRVNVGRICSVEGCNNPAHRRGMCNAHCLRMERHGSTDLPKREPKPKVICKVEGCDREVGKHGAKGMCQYHYKKLRPAPICTVDGCEERQIARGLCGKHYRRLTTRGTTEAFYPDYDPICSVDGCEKAEYTHGLCHRHYDMSYRKENAERLRRVNRRYLERNRQKIYKQRRAYLKKHPEKERAWNIRRRFRMLGGPQHNGDDELHVYNLAHGCCAYCGKHILFSEGHIDHRVPLARGGSNGIGNLEWACPQCNQSKNSKLLIAWLKQRQETSQKFLQAA